MYDKCISYAYIYIYRERERERLVYTHTWIALNITLGVRRHRRYIVCPCIYAYACSMHVGSSFIWHVSIYACVLPPFQTLNSRVSSILFTLNTLQEQAIEHRTFDM